MSENIRTLSGDDFDSVINSVKIPVLVDFWAAWCGPCKLLAPILNEVADELVGKVLIAKVNVDENEALCARFGISNIPTLIVYKNGDIVEKTVGLKSKADISALLIKHML